MIPKRLHRIWLGSEPKPANYQTNLDLFRALHPNWEIVEWNDSNLPELMCADEFARVDGLVWKADLLKREVLALYPGLYLDHDIVPLRNMDALLDCDEFVVKLSDATLCAAVQAHGPSGAFIPAALRYFPGALMARELTTPVGYAGAAFLNELWHKRFPNLNVLERVTFFPELTGKETPEQLTAEALPSSLAYHTWDGLGR